MSYLHGACTASDSCVKMPGLHILLYHDSLEDFPVEFLVDGLA